MKQIKTYVQDYLREEFHRGHFLTLALFLLISLTLNYSLNLFNMLGKQLHDRPLLHFAGYFFFYSVPYFFAIFAHVFFRRKRDFLRRRGFWLLSFVILGSLALDGPTTPHWSRFRAVFPPELVIWILKISYNLIQFTVLTVPPLLYLLIIREKSTLRLLRLGNLRLRPYLMFLLLLAPVLFFISFRPDFMHTYPRYRTTFAASYLEISPAVPLVAFEFFYGLAFIAVEFFFRGFIIVSLGRYLDRGAILPMTVVYCFFHFSKPLLEAVSSIFGGFILGIISFYSLSIWGGIIAHLGTAWLMELAGFLQLFLHKR